MTHSFHVHSAEAHLYAQGCSQSSLRDATDAEGMQRMQSLIQLSASSFQILFALDSRIRGHVARVYFYL